MPNFNVTECSFRSVRLVGELELFRLNVRAFAPRKSFDPEAALLRQMCRLVSHSDSEEAEEAEEISVS